MPITPAALRTRFLLAVGALPLAACSAGPKTPGEACLYLAKGETTCPTEEAAAEQLVGDGCGQRITSVDGPGELREDTPDTGTSGDRCCYPVTVQTLDDGCVVGRPYYEEGRLVTAPATRAKGWSNARRPRVQGLSAAERRVLADAWGRDALIEHASVAAFTRFAAELLAIGAPADLVDAALSAARDEVRHARLAFALASGYAGAPVAPGPFPFPSAMPLTTDLAALAAATAQEGAVGETVVALLAVEALEAATDPAVRRVLAVIAEDESRHAELAWRAVRWMIEVGGPPVREAVAAVLERAALVGVHPPAVTFGAAPEVLAAHGRIRADRVARMVARALDEVVGPVGAALLAA